MSTKTHVTGPRDLLKIISFPGAVTPLPYKVQIIDTGFVDSCDWHLVERRRVSAFAFSMQSSSGNNGCCCIAQCTCALLYCQVLLKKSDANSAGSQGNDCLIQ